MWNHNERGKRLSEKVIFNRKHSSVNRGEVHRPIHKLLPSFVDKTVLVTLCKMMRDILNTVINVCRNLKFD